MENKNPFSVYDFLGYFIPGALFFYLMDIFSTTIEIKWLENSITKNISTFNETLSFIIISYVLGHAINYISSVTIERYSIWSMGYPSRYILGETRNCYFKKWKETCIESKKFGRRLFEFGISVLWRIGLLIIILPMFLIDLIIGRLLCFRRHYTNSIDETLKSIITKRIDIFKEKHNKYNNNNSTPDSGDYFRLIYYYCYEKHGAFRVKFDNYVALYGFTRAISLVFCIYSWILLIQMIVDIINQTEYQDWHLIAFVLSSFLSYFFYLAFIKFYRRYTLEGFMCLTIDTEFESSEDNKLF